MKQYTFKDGFKCVASTKEEAIAQHKVVASGREDFTYDDRKTIQAFFDSFCKRCDCKIGNKKATCKGKNINITITRVNKQPKEWRAADFCEVSVNGKIGDNKIAIKKEFIGTAITQLEEEIKYLKGDIDNLSKVLKELGFKKEREGEWTLDNKVDIEKVNNRKYLVSLRSKLLTNGEGRLEVPASGIKNAIAKLAKKLIARSKQSLKEGNELLELVSK